MKKLFSTSIAATAMASAMAVAPAQAEVSASVSIATSYLWRGNDLGSNAAKIEAPEGADEATVKAFDNLSNGRGAPAVSADLSYSNSGFHTGVWVSSGDSVNGTEYDLWAGYGGEVEGFSYDVSLWTYVYPTKGESDDNLGDLSEVILSVGYGALGLSYYDNVAGDSDYSYLTLSAGYEAFSATLGMHSNSDDSAADYSHLDLSYAYNDNLTFTISKVIDQDDAKSVDRDANIVVSYSLPLK